MSEPSTLNPIAHLPVNILAPSGNGLEGRVRAAQNAAGDNRKAELRKVAQEFEALFIAQLLKVMRETIEDSGLMDGGFGKSIYTEMFDQEVSLAMARHGTLKIADILCNKLSDDVEPGAEKPGEAPADKTLPNPTAAPQTSPDPPAVQRAMPDPLAVPKAMPEETGKKEKSECVIEDFQFPVRGRISSAFGLRKDPISRQMRFHKGLDIAAPEGMKVVAALPGTVISAKFERGYGNNVVIQHEGGLQTRYGHLASINVKAGDAVAAQGDLGTVGNTGHSTGSHLHFEVIRLGKPVDPLLSYNTGGVGAGSGNSKAGG